MCDVMCSKLLDESSSEAVFNDVVVGELLEGREDNEVPKNYNNENLFTRKKKTS
jgi:hypothetical protein